jgi:hypothetical protein
MKVVLSKRTTIFMLSECTYIRTKTSEGDTRWPKQERVLTTLRKRLDVIAKDQVDDPRTLASFLSPSVVP